MEFVQNIIYILLNGLISFQSQYVGAHFFFRSSTSWVYAFVLEIGQFSNRVLFLAPGRYTHHLVGFSWCWEDMLLIVLSLQLIRTCSYW